MFSQRFAEWTLDVRLTQIKSGWKLSWSHRGQGSPAGTLGHPHMLGICWWLQGITDLPVFPTWGTHTGDSEQHWQEDPPTPWKNNVILSVLSFLTFPSEQLYVLLITGLSFKAIWLYFFKWMYSSLSNHSSVGPVCVVSWCVCHLQHFSSFTPNSFSLLGDFPGVLFKK